MRLGRRTFLKLMGAALGHAALAAAPIPWVVQSTYVHKTLGIAFSKEASWFFIHPDKIAYVTAEIGKEHKSRYKFTPSLMNISKHEWNLATPRFCPGINVYRYDNVNTPLDSYLAATISMHKMNKGFRCTIPPTLSSVSGLVAFTGESEFIFNIQKLDQPTPIRMKDLVIRQDDRLYSITMCDCPEFGMDETIVFREFMNSLKIA